MHQPSSWRKNIRSATHTHTHTHTLTYLCYLAHVDGERLRPAIKQLEEKEAIKRRDFICIVDDKDVVRSRAHHPGHAVVGQEGTQVVISDPAVLPAPLWEVVEEHVEDLVTHVVVRTVEEEAQETGEKLLMPFSAKETFASHHT